MARMRFPGQGPHLPNARPQPRRAAAARHERRLPGVGCRHPTTRYHSASSRRSLSGRKTELSGVIGPNVDSNDDTEGLVILGQESSGCGAIVAARPCDPERTMRTALCTIEVLNGRAWARLSSSRAPGTARIPEVLRWLIEQLHLGNFDETVDDEGRLTGIVLGAPAAPPIDDATLKDIARQVETRALAVNVAGLFANAREEGVEPAHVALAKILRDTAQPEAHDNTAFHYALQLMDVLERIAKVTFVFESPPIKTRAAPGVIALLKEATRAYLFGLGRSCVCVCRALLEAALRGGVSEHELLQERFNSKKGELESLIGLATKRRRLSSKLAQKAHAIRQAGNRALHGINPSDDLAWDVLQDTRTIVSRSEEHTSELQSPTNLVCRL